MPKQTLYCYADLETTTVDTTGYKDYADYLDNAPEVKYPQIYSWMISHELRSKMLYTKKQLKEFARLGIINFFIKEYGDTQYVCYYGISGRSFLEFLMDIQIDIAIYFNNSSSFDGHFILGELLKAGFKSFIGPKAKEKVKLEEDTERVSILESERAERIRKYYSDLKVYKDLPDEEAQNKFVKKVWGNLMQGEFQMMVNENTRIYQLRIATNASFWSTGIKRQRTIKILDNILLFPASIANMGKDLAATYYRKDKEANGEPLHDLKYYENIYCKDTKADNYKRTELYNSIKEYEEDGNELEYLTRDVLILAEFQKLLSMIFPRNFWKMTSASTSYNQFLREFGELHIPNLLETNQIVKENLEHGGYCYRWGKSKTKLTERGVGKKVFSSMFETKWLDLPGDGFYTIHDEMYQWFVGGLVKVNEDHRGQVLENLTMIDRNSSYPDVMDSDSPCPYGKGIRGDAPGHPFKLYTMRVLKTITNEKGLPFLASQTNDKSRNYRKNLIRGDIIKLNSIEYEAFKKYYKASTNSYELTVDWSFKATTMKEVFGPYIEKWYKQKEIATEHKDLILKAIVKIFLNALYGKFGTKSIRISKIFDEEANEWIPIVERVKSEYYLPIAIVITTLARMALVDAVGDRYDDFVYCDTDSIIARNFDKLKWNHIRYSKSKLGDWDIEYEGLTGIARRPKQYYYIVMKNGKPIYEDGKVKKKVAFAGINFNRDQLHDEDYDDFEYETEVERIKDWLKMTMFIRGELITNQLKPFRVVGQGVILEEVEKSIKPVWDYPPLREQIYTEPKHFSKSLEKAIAIGL